MLNKCKNHRYKFIYDFCFENIHEKFKIIFYFKKMLIKLENIRNI